MQSSIDSKQITQVYNNINNAVLHFDIKINDTNSILLFLFPWLFLKRVDVSYSVVYFCPELSHPRINVTLRAVRRVVIHKEESCAHVVTIGTNPDIPTSLEFFCRHH